MYIHILTIALLTYCRQFYSRPKISGFGFKNAWHVLYLALDCNLHSLTNFRKVFPAQGHVDPLGYESITNRGKRLNIWQLHCQCWKLATKVCRYKSSTQRHDTRGLLCVNKKSIDSRFPVPTNFLLFVCCRRRMALDSNGVRFPSTSCSVGRLCVCMCVRACTRVATCRCPTHDSSVMGLWCFICFLCTVCLC